MNKFSIVLGAMLLTFSAAPSFAEDLSLSRLNSQLTVSPTANEVLKCVTLKEQAANHNKWSAALKKISSSSHRFTATQANTIAKSALNKIYEDINAVRETAGITDESDLLNQTEDLLDKVKNETISQEKSTDLMMDKLQELDDEMFETLRLAHKEFPSCDLFERRARAATKSSDPTIQ